MYDKELAALRSLTAHYNRLGIWSLLAVLISLDAAVGSPISLGLLYFVPLVIAALLLSKRDLLLMALSCMVARYLFGPTGDPLGLQGATYQLPVRMLPAANAVISAIAYAAAAVVALRLREQQQQIIAMGAQIDRDPLTGLGNRRMLERWLRSLSGRQGSVIAVDLDHFKRVNDSYGHPAGDAVLQELARRLQSCTRDGDVVVRMGGEEFLVLLPQTQEEAARSVAGRILGAVSEGSFPLPDGRNISLTTSLGLATGQVNEALLEQSDAALYRAKSEGRNRYVLAAGTR